MINKMKQPNHPWNISFSWSAAIQLPILDLCKGKGGELPLEEMEQLYIDELKIASDASLGQYEPPAGASDGAHVGVREKATVA